MEEGLKTLIYLSAGLFMGWSLGANDAANIFGTAVATRMIRFKTAALLMSLFIALGAVVSGSGPAATLGALGAVTRIEEAFLVSLTAAVTVMVMTRRGLPVSTSQAIVGALVGWNLHSGESIDMSVLTKIASTWVVAPLLGALFAMGLYLLMKMFHERSHIHLVKMDRLIRVGLVLSGIFGAYSLGASNMANVMGVFTNSFSIDLVMGSGRQMITSQQLLFLLGAAAISLGVYTYSHRVMQTVGSQIYRLTPPAALVVVLSSALVLFLFASQGLKSVLIAAGLPSLPLVPVSQSQTVVGAVIGIGLVRGGRNLNLKMLGTIMAGWVITPLAAMILAFFLLSFV
ncbi:inorganic phosphate transporter [Anoxynatronum buryatiense]|uniref:Inorganic phosphate transporter, PiT family n=1 Tax=Anoxynatronum buryatiense TaxID=489973 RepID=A0AA45WU74_9CLOT|nr:inorganic phosphate transporter [Anoxynatronum buryatiense]SMP41852.1 inorganic phosphate transporter, PiT family [Anoxynatronum buryatiense]